MPNAQTIATKKWQEKKGIIKKSFTTTRSTADRFKEACDAAGVSQSSALNEFMEEFIEKHSASN